MSWLSCPPCSRLLFVDFLQENRLHAPTLIVPLPFDQLTMSTRFTDEFWKEALKRDPTRRFGKGVDVYKIWNEKIVMMHEVAQHNPFGSQHFVWADAGYFRRKTDSPQRQPIVRNNMTATGVRTDQLLMHNIVSKPEENQYEIAGGVFGGTKTGIERAYEAYFKTFWHMARNDIDCIGFEQRVFVHMCQYYPDVCVLNYSDHWFKLGQRWLRNPNYNFGENRVSLEATLDPQEPRPDENEVLPTTSVIRTGKTATGL